MPPRVTRLAPSPTGKLHLGNARTFLINWALARQNGWRIIMRIEDLDQPRVRPDADKAALAVLQWLGIDFDDGPLYQFHDLNPYRAAMRILTDRKLAYSCQLTRKQIQYASSAPHLEGTELRFPPQLRSAVAADFSFDSDNENFRFIVHDQTINIHDQFAGDSTHNPFNEIGDFIIWTKLGVPSYQLAVVVDDARQGVTDVVRGDDLLPSAARQSLLYRALDLPEPHWWHVPLVLAEDGRRLAKRDGDLHLETYQNAGVRPQRVIGLMAKWCGIRADRTEMTASDFLQRFRIDTLSHEPVRFTKDDHACLLQT